MIQLILNFGFLYVPEDKSAYFPAAIQFGIMIILCVLTFRWIRRMANKQADAAKILEARALAERDAKMNKEASH
ncbi:hypothetical protein [Solibacillus sp. CAU 1738]|uniref:hypothetical protein n=1 Tax=Solibacillus sp. CAU 1738 TaxID=3140363 RepID=UPI003260D804